MPYRTGAPCGSPARQRPVRCIAILLVAGTTVAIAFATPMSRIEAGAMTARVSIDSVRVIAMPTYPVRYQVVVQGRKLAGIAISVVQVRTAGRISLELTQHRPAGETPASVPFTERIFLEGGLGTGTYVLSVNGHEEMLEVR